jgi:S-layer homology domain.
MLCAFLFTSVVGNVKAATAFSDVPENAWFYPYVTALTQKGIVNGTSDGYYSPQGTFTVAECAAIITRYLGLERVASAYAEELSSNQVPGSGKWYSGYIQLMYELNIIGAPSIGGYAQGKYIAFDDMSKVERPVARCEFASYISRSFELSGQGTLANNVYPEIGGLGHEFIIGGAYDVASYEKYMGDIIDYWSIPESARIDVLKAYYNGIFNGDQNGNFNPYEALTRAEMAKVIAVVTDMSMRTRKEYRVIPDGMTVQSSDFTIDSHGNQMLLKNKGYDILSLYAQHSILINSAGSATDITYIHSNLLPPNYAVDVSINEYLGKGFVEKKFVGLSTPGAQNTPYTVNVTTAKDQYSVLFVLRNLSQSGKIEGVLTIVPNNNGGVIYYNNLS